MTDSPRASRLPGVPDASVASLRALPAVHQLVDRLVGLESATDLPRSVVTDVARVVIERHRAALTRGDVTAAEDPMAVLCQHAVRCLQAERARPLEAVINATGIIIHTGLGRAPLPAAAIDAMVAAAAYSPIELDLPTGERGHRSTVVRGLLCELTGAEAATVVNNNAAAVVLTLAALAAGRTVLVSRGELVEIGGSFRMPDVMAAGGVRLREVGTTNRTHLADYEAALDDDVAAIMKVHPSNFRVEGFTHSVGVDRLAGLARRRGIPLIDDVGSGALRPAIEAGPLAGEPAAASAVAAGADLVLFSGDKLLGGPQAGIIVGRSDLVDRIDGHPLMRAFRVDKLRLAALAATLRLHRDEHVARSEVPVRAMAATPVAALAERGERLRARLRTLVPEGRARVAESEAYLGGGSVPAHAIPSRAIVLEAPRGAEHDLALRLRTGRPAVVPRLHDGRVWLDLRTVLPAQDDDLVAAVARAWTMDEAE